MISRDRRGGLLRDVLTLFDTGTTGELSDGELLGQFAERKALHDAAEPAFAALVDRHAPMVLRVCRSILRDDHDALDAFQATFLVLVRRADAVRRRESAASWLHGVALRVSAHARADMARRRRHERQAGELALSADRSAVETNSHELAAVLHEELGRLPERYRAPLVLCYLEGHTCEAAARRLGWPVGTVKSRLARGRERLRGQITRRGLAPEEASERLEQRSIGAVAGCSASTGSTNACESLFGVQATGGSPEIIPGSWPGLAVVIPAGLSHATVKAMVLFAAGRPIAGAVSASSLTLTLRTLRSLQMTRLASISALLIAGLMATGAAMLISQDRKTAQAQSAAPARTNSVGSVPATPNAPEKREEVRSVRVIDTRGKGVPGLEIKVLEEFPTDAQNWPGYRTSAHRTDADGRFQIAIDSRYRRLTLEARQGDRTIGWVSLNGGLMTGETKATTNPVTLTLLARNHQVEGTVVDTRGKPIRGVLVRAVQFNHDVNAFATDYPDGSKAARLATAVTDEAGRYQLALPQNTIVHFVAYHARFAGPMFSCRPEVRTIKPVRLEDAGGIAGTVIDVATGGPVAGASVAAQALERANLVPGGGWGSTSSDAQGHFAIGGLTPGVYNLLFRSSPQGRRFTARAVEGVRVKAGEEARADLKLIAGRRLHGTAVEALTGKPLARVNILCYNSSHPRSGAGCQGTFTDDRGYFELFVPPGPVFVYINGSGNGLTRSVLEDRDPDPIVLKQGDDSNAKQPVRLPVECEVRVRVKTDTVDHPEPKDDRSVTGRVFDQHGSPLVAVQVDYNNARSPQIVATDRMGIFRMKGLSEGPLLLGLTRQGDQHGMARVPAGAVEIDVIFPQ